MYFWDIKSVIAQLSNNQIRAIEIFVYAVLLSLTFFLGINVITLLPKLYLFTFSYIKFYLEKQVGQAPLVIFIFSNKSDFFIAVNFIILCAGVVFALFIHKGTLKEFFLNTIALAWPICFRIMVITTIIFALVASFLSLYFGYKLMAITKMPIAKGPFILRPLKFLFKITGTYTPLKALWAQTQNLVQAQVVFDQINQVSYYLYWACQTGSVFSTMWWMLTLQEKIKLLRK